MQEWLAAAMGTRPRTALLVTHDLDEALRLCDRVVVLTARPGRVACELDGSGGGGHHAREQALGALR
jgi:ABC-type nitrate/sulfonate/bicarbonate transport system ATPase subunit